MVGRNSHSTLKRFFWVSFALFWLAFSPNHVGAFETPHESFNVGTQDAATSTNDARNWHTRTIEYNKAAFMERHIAADEIVFVSLMYQGLISWTGFSVALVKPNLAVNNSDNVIQFQNQSDFDALVALVQQISQLPKVYRWELIQPRTDPLFDRIIFPNLSSGSNVTLTEVSVWGWMEDEQKLHSAQAGYTTLPDALQTFIGLTREATVHTGWGSIPRGGPIGKVLSLVGR